jgi:RNA polymerase sigma-70 factor (ECF subfamily)
VAEDEERSGPEDQDSADVARVLSGDTAAFAGIVQRWQEKVVNLAWRFCRDRTMAEDMAQDAFLKAYRGLRHFRQESKFSTWLTSIALNTFRTAVKTRRPPAFDLVWEVPVPATQLAVLGADERAAAVRELVLTLPARYREPLVLFYFEEMNLEETARILGLPEGSLKARLHRGRELLKRRCVSRWGDDYGSSR